MVKIIYGTKDHISYFVQLSKEKLEKDNYASFLSEDKARQFAEALAKELEVPVLKM